MKDQPVQIDRQWDNCPAQREAIANEKAAWANLTANEIDARDNEQTWLYALTWEPWF
jgi:hypothetical protein